MSPVEWLVVALLVGVAIATVRTPRPVLVLVACVAAVLVGVLGTPRWQLLPAAFGVALLAGLAGLQLAHPDAPRTLPRLTAGIVVVGVATSALLAWALPVPGFALEEGSATVGTVAFDLVDETRTSPSGRDDGPRLTPVQAWFPTSADADGPRLRVTDEPKAFAAAASDYIGLPAGMLTHLGAVRTNAIDGAAPTADRLPVVLSIHGWRGFRFLQTPLLEQLAADGHLVLAMDHTHGAMAAQPAAGGVIPWDPGLLPDDVPPAVYDAAAQRLERTFADDAVFLLAAIRAGDVQVPAAVREIADLERLVVLGHSTGGGAAALLCAEQACDGMVLYDPWVEPVPADVRAAGFAAPSLVLLSEAWDGNDNDQVLRPMVDTSDEASLYVVEGTTHVDVTALPRLSPLTPRIGMAGGVPVARVDEIVTAMTRSWVARTLGTGVGDPDLVADPPFAELRRGQ